MDAKRQRAWVVGAWCAAVAGCASPVPRNGSPPAVDAAMEDRGAKTDATELRDQGATDQDAVRDVADAVDAVDAADVLPDGDGGGDVADAGDSGGIGDAGDVAVDVTNVDAAVDTGVPDTGVVDVGVVDAGPPTMRLTFVGGAFNGTSAGGTVRMRAVMTWHGAIRGTSDGGGISFTGWFR